MRWMDNMEEWIRMPFEDLLKKTRDRRKWSDQPSDRGWDKTVPLVISYQFV